MHAEARLEKLFQFITLLFKVNLHCRHKRYLNMILNYSLC